MLPLWSAPPFSCMNFDEATSVCWDFSSEGPKANLPGFAIGHLDVSRGTWDDVVHVRDATRGPRRRLYEAFR